MATQMSKSQLIEKIATATELSKRDVKSVMPDTAKRTIALRAPLIAASILVVIALAGNWLLRQLGIGIPAFQIAGGLLLFGVSYQMIFGDRPHREAREADKATAEHASDVAVFPLAIPMRMDSTNGITIGA